MPSHKDKALRFGAHFLLSGRTGDERCPVEVDLAIRVPERLLPNSIRGDHGHQVCACVPLHYSPPMIPGIYCRVLGLGADSRWID